MNLSAIPIGRPYWTSEVLIQLRLRKMIVDGERPLAAGPVLDRRQSFAFGVE